MQTMNLKTQESKRVVSNCEDIQRLFGSDCGLILFQREFVIVYGVLHRNKVFWSSFKHIRVYAIANYQQSITLSFLSDLSKQLDSMIRESLEREEYNKVDNSFSPNKDKSLTLQTIKYNLLVDELNKLRIKQSKKPLRKLSVGNYRDNRI